MKHTHKNITSDLDEKLINGNAIHMSDLDLILIVNFSVGYWIT